MRRSTPRPSTQPVLKKINPFRRWRKDESGATAIEFGAVALPFFMLIFGILGIGLHFFTTSSLEHAVESASRKVRTGQALSENLSVEDFRNEICKQGAGIIDCLKLRVHLQSAPDWSTISPVGCLDSNGALVESTGGGGGTSPSVGTYAGCSGTAYVVTACYESELAKAIPFLEMGTKPGKSGLMQASAAGRTEPHDMSCDKQP